MKESYVASSFNSIFSQCGILAPINNSQGGWPDRLLQLPNSKVVAAEIKSVQQLKNSLIRLVDFRNDQAAWLAKWQKNGGLCFLFIGITNFDDRFVGYGILIVKDWHEWIRLPNALIDPIDFDIISIEAAELLDWFAKYTESVYA